MQIRNIKRQFLFRENVLTVLASTLSDLNIPEDQEIVEAPIASNPNKDKVFGVFIHYADCLKLDFFVLHPIVR